MERKNERYHRGYQTCDTRFVLRWFESHGPRRALALFCAFFLALQVLIPCKAAFAYYPSEEVILGDQVTTDNFGTAGVGYMVIAYNNLRATLLALGVQPTDSRLTTEVRAKLSNASSGGSFYEYSTTFLTQSQLSGELPPWTFGVRDFIDTWETIAGSGDQYGPYMDVFYSSASRELYNNAKRDLNTILAGGSLGGGSSSGDYVFKGISSYYNGSSAYSFGRYKIMSLDGTVINTFAIQDVSGYHYLLMPSEYNIKVGNSILETVYENYPTEDYDYYMKIQYVGQSSDYNNVTYDMSFYIFSKNQVTLEYEDYHYTIDNQTVTQHVPIRLVNNGQSAISYRSFRVNSIKMSYDGGTFQTVNGTYSSQPSVYNMSSGETISVTPTGINGTIYVGGNANTGGSGGTPPNNWPTDPTPTPPTEPTVPDPPTSTPVDPPSDPVGGNPPSFPTQIITTGTTYPVADLQAVLDAMAEHCEHIRDEIYADTSGFYTNLTTYLEDEFEVLRSCIRGESQWMIQRIDSKLDDLADYLKELFEWLADELDFGFIGGDYDDSTVVSWLKRIYLKLGNGGVNTKPVDPVANPFDGWNWLGQLLEQLLTSLSGGAAALAGTLGQLFDGIKTKFPFSIPWDVAAILAVFDAAPVTPAFTIAYTVFGANVRYDIDMHFFDEQAAVIRAVQNILFCAYLLFKTDWLLNEFNNLGRFIGGKVVGSKG